MSEIKAEVKAIADKIAKNLELDSVSGIISEKEKTHSYKECLPESLTMDVVKEVADYNANFVAGGLMAAGEMAVKAMKKHNKLDEVSCRLKTSGRDYVDYDVKRQVTYKNSLQPEKGDITKMGVATVGYHVSAGKRSGQLELAMTQIREMATAQLK